MAPHSKSTCPGATENHDAIYDPPPAYSNTNILWQESSSEPDRAIELRFSGTQPRTSVDAEIELESISPAGKPGKLSSVWAKIERAKQQIADLNRILRLFYNAKPYQVGTHHDPNTRQLVYYVSSVLDTPAIIPLLAGEVIQSLRSALDHLAYQLFLAGGGSPSAAKHVYFPTIGNNAAEYKTKRAGQVHGMRQDAIDAIDAAEPYKGGKGHQLWVLNELNRIDKHRLLVTVGSAFRSFDLGAYMWPKMQEMVRQMLGTDQVSVPVLSAFLRPADRMCPLKGGEALFTDAPDAKVNEKLQFRFEVAINEPQVIESKSLIETVQHFADLVSSVVPPFEALV